jgi:hypothetical protein
MPESGRLTAELERLVLQQIRREFGNYNSLLFEGRLKAPAFEWLQGTVQLGEWNSSGRQLRLSRALLQQGWGALVEVLKHEMAHQYVDEVLGVRETPHGGVFREICAARGIDARAAGAPENPVTDATAGTLEKISKLLTLAESANEHEAHAAMAAAQRLLLKHNLEYTPQARDGGYCFRHVGTPTGRVFEHSRVIALILSEHFFVETLWVPVWRPLEGKRGSVIEICGTRENVDLAAYVHDFLVHSGERLWLAHKREHAIAGNAERREFLAGVMFGFKKKLAQANARHAREGLVWQGDPALGAFFKRRHPHTSWVRYGGRPANAARAQGEQAGQNLVLHRGLNKPSSTGAGLRLLPRG